MKVIIAGGRDFKPDNKAYDWTLETLRNIGCTQIVSGGARGADSFGEYIAKQTKTSLIIFNADWNKHGRAAGPIRNRQMAEYADALIVFPGGRGTNNMIQNAKDKGLMIIPFT